MWFIVTLLVFFILLSGALGFACYNMLKKIEVYEEWTNMFRTEISEMYSKIKELDEREMFSKDDDVGFAFTEIVRIIKEFDEKIK